MAFRKRYLFQGLLFRLYNTTYAGSLDQLRYTYLRSMDDQPVVPPCTIGERVKSWPVRIAFSALLSRYLVWIVQL